MPTANQIDPTKQMPVVAPDGTLGAIPLEDWDNAQKQGFGQALFATSPEGKLGILHPSDVESATKAGFRVNQLSPSDLANQALAQNPKSAGIKVAPIQVAAPQPKPQGIIPTLWNAANTPVADLVTDPHAPRTADVIAGAIGDELVPGMGAILATPEGRQSFENQAVASGDPLKGAVAGAITGLVKNTGDTLAPFTSPLSLATAATGPASKIPGLLGRVARIVSTAAGVGFGVQGGVNAGQAATGTGDFSDATPEQRIQGGLQGASQVLFGAAAAHGVPQAAEDTVALARQGNEALQRSIPNAIARTVIPESLQTSDTIATGAARQAAKQGNNLSAALDQGGNAPRGVMTHEDVAQPVLDDLRAEAARQGVTQDHFTGRNGYVAGKKLTEGVRQQYDGAYNALIDPIREEPASAAAKAASDEVVNKMLADSSLLDEIKRGTPDGTNVQQLQNIAGSIRNSRTVGELDTARQALNRLASAFEGKTEGQQYVSPLVQKSMSEGASAIRNALYNDIAQRYGGMTVNGESVGIPADEIRDLQRAHGAAIQADQMMGDTARNLSSVASAESAKPSAKNFIARLGYRATMGSKSHAAAGVLEKLFGGSDIDLFNTRMKRVISGASSDEGRTFPTPPITPEYVDKPEVPDMRTSPVAPRLPAPPPEAQVVPPSRRALPPFFKGELPPASRSYGVPEQPTVDITTNRGATNDVLENAHPGSVALGPNGKNGVLIRRLGLLKGTTEESPAGTQAGEPPAAPNSLDANHIATRQAPAELTQDHAYPGPDRRTNLEARKRVAEMSPDERAQALLTSDKTGLPNYRAFQESARSGKPVVGYLDLDDFHGVNSRMTHSGVDQVILPAIGDLLARIAKEDGVDLFHRSGDEFLARGSSPEAVTKVFQRVQDELANATFEYQTPDGATHVQKGIGASYGTGSDEVSAESAATASKADRKAAGLRVGARDQAVSGEVTQGQQVGSSDAGRQDLQPPTGVSSPAPRVSTAKPVAQYQGGAAIEGSTGNQTTVLTPTNAYPAKYRVVEASSLRPSHDALTFAKNQNYPEGVQERAYHTSKEAQNRVIQQAQNFNHAFVLNTDPTAGNGPSVITPDGTVLGGNSRAMTIQRLYRSGQGEAYRNALAEGAAQFGVSPEHIASMHEPVLVREIQNPSTVDEARRVGSELNKPMTAALGVSERAVSAGKSFTPETLGQISDMVDATDGGTLRDVLRDRGRELVSILTRDGIITDRERPQFIDTATGGLSEEGKTFVERALLGSVVDDPTLMDRAPKSILNKLEGSLGDLSQLGARTDEYNILPLVRDALAEHADIAQRGTTVDLHLGQTSMYGPARNSAVDVLVRALVAKPKEVRAALRSFSQDASFDTPGQSTLGFGEKPTPVGAFNAAFKANLSEGEFIDGLLNSLAKAAQPGGTITEARTDVSNSPTEEGGASPSAGGVQSQPTGPAPRRTAAGVPQTPARNEPAAKSLEAINPSEPDLYRTEGSARPFFSRALQVAEQKLPNSAQGESIANTLRNNGVKADEIKWLGLEDWLNGQGKVSKQQVLDYIRANQLQVKEVTKGANEGRVAQERAVLDARKKYESLLFRELMHDHPARDNRRVAQDAADDIVSGYSSGYQTSARILDRSPNEELAAAGRDLFNASRELDSSKGNNTKFSQYTLPGGENYRELLMTLPAQKVRGDVPSQWAVIGPNETAPNGKKSNGFRVFDRNGDLLSYGETRVDALNQALNDEDIKPGVAPFQSGHFDEPNIVAHLRFNDRTDAAGKRVMFIEEIQSDWHQKGRKEGYKHEAPTAADIEVKYIPPQVPEGHDPSVYPGYWESFDKRTGKMITRHGGRMSEDAVLKEAIQYGHYASESGVPDAPFKTTWHELALKRAIRYAAENGYDKIAWTTGAQQNARYDLSKQVQEVRAFPHGDGTFDLSSKTHDGQLHDIGSHIAENKLDDYVGKELAQKIANGEGTPDKSAGKWRVFSGLDLKVGGSGMKGFYDKIIPDFLNKYAKKWGAKVGETKVVAGQNTDRVFVGTEPSMVDLEKVWKDSYGTLHTSVNNVLSHMQDGKTFSEAMDSYGSEELAERLGGKMQYGKPHMASAHSLDVTPAMRDSVMNEGQPLFRSGQAVGSGDHSVTYVPPSGKSPARVELNPSAMKAVSAAIGGNVEGFRVSVERAGEIADMVRSSAAKQAKRNPQTSRSLNQIADAIDHAAQEPTAQKFGVIAFNGASVDAAAEEMAHATMQAAPGGGNIVRGVPDSIAQHPVFQAMKSRIGTESGMNMDKMPTVHAAEGFVDLMLGEHPEVSTGAAENAIHDYVDALHAKTGEEGIAEFTSGAQALRQLFAQYNTTAPKGLDHVEAAIRQLPTQGAGGRGVVQADESGVAGRQRGEGTRAATETRSAQPQTARPATDPLDSWVREARTLSASPAGEQNDLFGNPEPMYRLTRTDANGDTEHFLVTESQYQQLRKNPQAQRALNAGRQSGLFSEQDVAQGEIHGAQAKPSIQLPPQESKNQPNLFRAMRSGAKRTASASKLPAFLRVGANSR